MKKSFKHRRLYQVFYLYYDDRIHFINNLKTVSKTVDKRIFVNPKWEWKTYKLRYDRGVELKLDE